MADCGDPFRIEELLSTYQAKCAECNCDDCSDLPSVPDDLCKPGGYFLEIYNAIQGLIARSGSQGCDSMVLPSPEMDPGPPPRCPDYEYVSLLVEYLRQIDCSEQYTCEFSSYDAVEASLNQPPLAWLPNQFAFADNGRYFPPGTYEIQYLRGMHYWVSGYPNCGNYGLNYCTNFPDLNCNESEGTVGYKFRPCSVDYDGTVFIHPYLDNKGIACQPPSQMLTTEISENWWRGKTTRFTITGRPRRIGFVLNTLRGNTRHNQHGFEDAVFSLRPCPECTCESPLSARWREPGPGLQGQFEWVAGNDCIKEHRIVYRRVPGDPETCQDQIDTETTAHDYCRLNELDPATDYVLTARHPDNIKVQGLAAGVYCARVDAIYVPREGEPEVVCKGEQWCFQSDCTEDELPVLELIQPSNYSVRRSCAGCIATQPVQYNVRNAVQTDEYLNGVFVRSQAHAYSPNDKLVGSSFGVNVPSFGCREYTWQVIATNPCGTQTASPVFRFSWCAIETPPTCNNGLPGIVNLTSWTVQNGQPIKDLRGFKFAGGTYDRWEMIEGGYYRLMSGPIVGGKLVGLPDFYTPPNWNHPGYITLRKICN